MPRPLKKPVPRSPSRPPGKTSAGHRPPTQRSGSTRNRESTVLVPKVTAKRFYGHGLPGINLGSLSGKLIVIEGADGSGRSTQLARLVTWMEATGHHTVQVGLKRSTLVSEELELAQHGNTLSRTTLSLFYATDFADQLENTILPALRAGSIVLADRYIYTLMARDLVRSADASWLRNLYGIALVPDAVFYLEVSPEVLVQRVFAKNSTLDYWESGMDIGLSRDIFDSFMEYQARMRSTFRQLQQTYGFDIIHGERSPDAINEELRRRIEQVLVQD